MAIKLRNGKYACGYCKKEFADHIDAERCKESHKLIYLAISQEDLNKLVLFIFTKDDAVLPENLVERLQKFLKNSFNSFIES